MNTHSILNIRTAVIASALAVALVSPALHAQDPTRPSRVNVPFAFDAGSTHFAAGTYTLSNPEEHILSVQGRAHSALMLNWFETGTKPAAESKAVFDRYGNQYFLREVWTKGEVDHILCPESKAEREIRGHQRAEDRASLATPTHVEIALLQNPR